jgi:hypothetical protein
MLLRKFRKTGPDIVILIVVILLLTWSGAFLNPHLKPYNDFDVNPMPLFSFLLSLTGFSHFISVTVAFLLVLLIIFLLVNFNTSDFFISERTFLPALIYVLFNGYFPEYQFLNPVLPATVFIILGIKKIVESYKVEGIAFSFFDAGMMIGIASLFYAGMIWFGILLFIGIALMRSGSIKEIVISLLGLATPAFLIYGFMYVTGKDMGSLVSAVNYNLFTNDVRHVIPGLTAGVLIVTAVIVIISMAQLFSVINNKKIKSRKTFILLLWAFFIAGSIYFLSGPVAEEIFLLIVIPPVYFISHYLIFSRSKRIPEIILLVLFILAALVQVVSFIR